MGLSSCVRLASMVNALHNIRNRGALPSSGSKEPLSAGALMDRIVCPGNPKTNNRIAKSGAVLPWDRLRSRGEGQHHVLL